jgi:hypothetical protein
MPLPYQFPWHFGAAAPPLPPSPANPANATSASLGRSLLVDPITGDLVVTGGQLQFVTGTAYIGQLIKSRLALFQGEYMPNVNEGMPWYQSILVKGYNANIIKGAFTTRILGTPGVVSIVSLTLTFNTTARSLVVAFVVQTSLGLLSDQYLIPITPTPQGQ